MSVAGKKDEEGKKLLHNIWGEVPKKEITAIMGPSGAGKSTLLNILAGRTRTKGNLTVSADVRLDNFSVDPTDVEVRKQIAFVAQDDSLNATSTPREAIRFSAKLRLPRTTTEEELDALTNRMLNALGLMNCAETYIGGPLIKGISGGERKRTSVGVELVTKPSLIFLDEPTSGLDSFSASQVVDLLHKVANAGSSVLFTIHQPSSEVFNAFDHLILLNKGHVMYNGSVQKVPDYFEARKHPVPANYNPADWIMSVAQINPIEQLRSDGFFEEESRFSQMGQSMKIDDGKDAIGNSLHDENAGKDTQKPGFFTQASMLYAREFKNAIRDKASLGTRFGITIFLNLLFGIIFYQVGKQPNTELTNTSSHFGALIMVVLSGMFGSAQPTLFAIPEERPVFLREYSTNHYSVGAYFLARFSVEAITTFIQTLVACLCNYFLIGFQTNFFIFVLINYAVAMSATALAVFLGCSIDDAKMAQEFLPLLFVPQMLFAGFFVAISLLPNWLQWVPYICSLTYGIKLGLLAEFESCVTNEDPGFVNCAQIMTNADADPDQNWVYWVVLIAIFFVTRLLGLAILKKKASDFY